MRTLITFIAFVAILVVCCTKTQEQREGDAISGVYVREYSFTVKNPETSEDVGMRTVRDTIFIKAQGSQFEVSNHKWMLNDYDKEGWRNMAHSDDRPFVTHLAELNGSKLESADLSAIFFDMPNSTAYVEKPTNSYQKVN